MATVIDVTGVQYFVPLVTFLLVFLVTLALFMKLKVFSNLFLEIFISFLIAILFISFVGPQKWVQSVTPAIAILIISAFFVLLLAGMFGKGMSGMTTGMGIIFVVIAFIIFIVSAFVVFSGSISSYLPGGNVAEADPNVNLFTDWLFSSRVGGGILLLIVSALVAWVLVKVKG